MKIRIIGTAHPYRGGLAAFNERLANEYTLQGHDVVIYTFTKQYPNFLFPGKTQYSETPAPKALKISRKIHSYNPLNWLKIGREIADEKPDIVIFAYWMSFMAPCMGTIARKIHKNHHTKIIALIHNMIPHEPNLLDKILPQLFVNQMDGFMALSESVVRDINKYDKKNCPKAFSAHPIYDHYGNKLPRETALQLLNLEPQYRYVLFFGFIRDYKGLDLLISAFADEKIKNLGLKLLVAGEFYTSETPYLEQIQRLQLEDKIILRTDYIPDDEVNLYFSAADIVIQPYKTATQSGVTQIAFHFGTPMIVTNVGGLPEIVIDGKIGYITSPDAHQIAIAIDKYFSGDKQSEFEQNILEEKKKYAWSKFTSTIDGIIEKIDNKSI